MHPVGDRADRHRVLGPAGPEVVPDVPGHLPVALGHAVDPRGEIQGQHRHLKPRAPDAPGGGRARAPVPVSTPFLPRSGRCTAARCSGSNASWPAGTGVWVVKTVLQRTSATASFHAAPADDQLAHPLQHHEGGVPLVRVPDAGVDPDGTQHPHAGDAEQPFLPQAQVRPAAVELVEQGPVVGMVLLPGWCRGDTAAPGPPAWSRPGHAPARPNVCTTASHGSFFGPMQLDQRRQRGIDWSSLSSCHPSHPEPLIEIPLHVAETDADQGHPEIGGGLAMIAGQNSQTAAVDRHRIVQPELGAEVGHRAGEQARVSARKPGAFALLVARRTIPSPGRTAGRKPGSVRAASGAGRGPRSS